MSDLQTVLKKKVALRGAALQEVIDSLPCLTKDSLTEAEAEEACAALAPHLGTASKVMDLIRGKVTKAAQVKKTLKSVLTPKSYKSLHKKEAAPKEEG